MGSSDDCLASNLVFQRSYGDTNNLIKVFLAYVNFLWNEILYSFWEKANNLCKLCIESFESCLLS